MLGLSGANDRLRNVPPLASRRCWANQLLRYW